MSNGKTVGDKVTDDMMKKFHRKNKYIKINI